MSNEILYTPTEVSNLTLAEIKKLQAGKAEAVRVSLPGLNDKLKRLRPGSLTTVIALPSNWKTGLMQYMARDTAGQLDVGGNECVVFVTWEVAVEEMGVLDLGNAAHIAIDDLLDGNVKDWGALEKAALRRATTPIYVIGHSLQRRKSRPQLTMPAVAEALHVMEEERGLKPKIIFLDYLQRIQWESEGGADPRLQFSRNVDRAKDLSLQTGAPVVLGCQAKNDIMTRQMKLPRMNDGMETSNIQQTSDNVITLWRPLVTEGEGAEIEVFGQTLTAKSDLLITHLAKQKFGEVGGWWPVSVDFATGEVRGQITLKQVRL